MGELANCERCNRVFVKQFRDICNECYKKEEEDFRRVYNFLRKRENRTATIGQIVEVTGVDETLIQKFIREKGSSLQISRIYLILVKDVSGQLKRGLYVTPVKMN